MTPSIVEVVARAAAESDDEDYMESCAAYDRRAAAALKALDEAGHAVVPKEPTAQMLDAALGVVLSLVWTQGLSSAYAAMLQAAKEGS